MKKTFIFLAMALMSVACTKDMNDDVVVNNVRDELTISLAPETKVHLTEAEGVYQTVWDKNDWLSVFNFNDGNGTWQFKGAAGALSGTIAVKVAGSGSSREDIVILYPSMLGKTDPKTDKVLEPAAGITGTTLTNVKIPELQGYTENSYGYVQMGSAAAAGNVMVAWGESADEPFLMKNLLGWVKLAIKGTGTVKSIALASADGEQIAGFATVDYKNLSATLTANDDEAYTKVVLDCGTGVALDEETPTYFYIGVLPHEFKSGLTVTVTGNGEADFSKSTGAVEIKRNTIQEFGALEYNKAAVVEGPKPGPMQFTFPYMNGAAEGLLDLGITMEGYAVMAFYMEGELFQAGAMGPYEVEGGADGVINIAGQYQITYSDYVDDSSPFNVSSMDILQYEGQVTPLANPQPIPLEE